MSEKNSAMLHLSELKEIARREGKHKLLQSIFDVLNLDMNEVDYSKGSTITKASLQKISDKISDLNGFNRCISSTKKQSVQNILNLLNENIDEHDYSDGGTITGVALAKILIKLKSEFLDQIKNLRTLPHQPVYVVSPPDNIVSDLYIPCLSRATRYVRGAAYFKSSVFRLMTVELLDFFLNGGDMTLLTSTSWFAPDFDAVRNEENQTKSKAEFLFELESLYRNLLSDPNSEREIDLLQLFVALVYTGKLEVKIALKSGGIYHEKKGYFADKLGNIVCFDGSGNETLSGLGYGENQGNRETFNVSYSWDDNDWTKRGEKWKTHLDSSIEGKEFDVFTINEIDEKFIKKLNVNTDLSHYKHKIGSVFTPTKTDSQDVNEKVVNPLNLIENRSHQLKALECWRKNNKRGIFEHATGSGKTITALACAQETLESGFHVMIVVPSIPLLNQWSEEIDKFPCFSPYPKYIIGGSNSLSDHRGYFEMIRHDVIGDPTISIVLKHALRKPMALKPLNSANKADNLDNFLLIFDECHRAGEQSMRPFCNLRFGLTLGLSATPKREAGFSTAESDSEKNDISSEILSIGDNEAISNLLGPIIHTYTLSDALKHQHLTQFEYRLDSCTLTLQEQEEYEALRESAFRSKDSEGNFNESGQIAIHCSRRIVRSASAKIRIAANIVKKFQPGESWLIYCDNSRMLSDVRKSILDEDPSLSDRMLEYSSRNMHVREDHLEQFKSRGGILLAMKCLDEGVSVERISHGLVLSSSTVQREFIQRRGRMLRKFEGKEVSIIYDIITLPHESGNSPHIESILRHEINRFEEFSKLAINQLEIEIYRQDIGL